MAPVQQESEMVFKNAKPKSQFSLPKSNRMMAPKKLNAVLDIQSDAAVGMPSKVKVVGKKFDKKRDTDKDMM